MRRRLPPLTTLEGFEAAARLGSFAAAADSLGLTQSAISHQIRLLELALGQPLFRRLHRKIVLTDAGRDFQRSVHNTLQVLREGVGRLEPYRKPGSVVVYCDAALASAWLAPRLVDLRRAHPQIDIWLDTSNQAVDFERDEVDILIRRQGDEQAPQGAGNLRSTKLFDDWLRPLAAPKLARALRHGLSGKGKGEREPGVLLSRMQEVPLLHEEGFDGWPVWFEKAGCAKAKTEQAGWLTRGPNFGDAHVMLQSAAAGLGLALATEVIAAPFLTAKSLAWVSPVGIAAPSAYIVTAAEDNLADADIRQTFDWIVAQAASQGAASGESGTRQARRGGTRRHSASV